MKFFQPKSFSAIKNFDGKQFSSDIIAGIIVAIIALPLSIALAIASGVEPERGLYTAIVAGFVISLLGGSNVNISGPTAAFATIVAGIVASYGVSGLVIATIMAGIILVVMGLCRLGVLIKYIPHTITTGFTSGIALTIVIGQLKDFLGLEYPAGVHNVETLDKAKNVIDNIGTAGLMSVIVGLFGLAILIVWPRIKYVSKIPASLIAVIAGTAAVKLLHLNVSTIGDLYPDISGAVPTPSLPSFDFSLIKELVPSAFTIAILAAIESLLSCVVSDGMIKDKHDPNTELIAQGAGNICSGIFGGIPATGAIARTAANVKNGGRTPVAGMVHALVLLLILVILMPYAKWIPMPIIASILFMVAYNMCEWRQFVKICKTAPLGDILVLVLTFVLTVVFDLVVAIEVGLVVAVVLFMKRMADSTTVRRWTHDETDGREKRIPDHVEVYDIDGPLFFATTEIFSELHTEKDTKCVIIRMHNIPAMDISALRGLSAFHKKCAEDGIKLIVSHVNEQPLAVMKKAGFSEKLGSENIAANIDEALVIAEK